MWPSLFLYFCKFWPKAKSRLQSHVWRRPIKLSSFMSWPCVPDCRNICPYVKVLKLVHWRLIALSCGDCLCLSCHCQWVWGWCYRWGGDSWSNWMLSAESSDLFETATAQFDGRDDDGLDDTKDNERIMKTTTTTNMKNEKNRTHNTLCEHTRDLTAVVVDYDVIDFFLVYFDSFLEWCAHSELNLHLSVIDSMSCGVLWLANQLLLELIEKDNELCERPSLCRRLGLRIDILS